MLLKDIVSIIVFEKFLPNLRWFGWEQSGYIDVITGMILPVIFSGFSIRRAGAFFKSVLNILWHVYNARE